MKKIETLSIIVTIISLILIYYLNTHKAQLLNSVEQIGEINKENNILYERVQRIDNTVNKEIKQSSSTNKFTGKVIFSGIFTMAALFIILSKKYDDETKKWAFSVLTLIAGVWIGSVT